MLFTALANHSKTMVLLLLALAQSLQDLLPEKTGMLYLMSKNGSSLQPDTVKHITQDCSRNSEGKENPYTIHVCC